MDDTFDFLLRLNSYRDDVPAFPFGDERFLNDAAALAGWPTPAKQNADGGARRQPDARGWNPLQTIALTAGWQTGGPNQDDQSALPPQANLAGWPTAAARDWRDCRSNQHGKNARPLNEVSLLSAWPNGAKLAGLISTSAGAETRWVALPDRAVLNAEFSLWLQGFPVEAVRCVLRATASCPRSRRSS